MLTVMTETATVTATATATARDEDEAEAKALCWRRTELSVGLLTKIYAETIVENQIE